MSRLVSRAESWERVYLAFENINFAAFDYNTIKQSLLDYIKLYFPESFNDFIETDEFIAIVESFAYIAEQIAYRLDVNAHENFISTAQRKDSILRLAKLISYTASRPLPARGLVKISTVTTTENVIDANNINLANTSVRWNDPSNSSWKEQFILVMNRVLDQIFGTVGPNDRFQVLDVLFELYNLNLVPLPRGVFKYTANANGQSVPMELVPVEHNDVQGIIERRPANNANFTLMYASDGLGDASETTGFMCLTKQGSLQRFRTQFDGVTPNQFYDVPATNANDIDVWLNNVDPVTGDTLDLPSPISFHPSWTGKSGEWVQVDLAHAQNVIFNTNPNRNKYETETRDENRVRLIFGDGEYADVPSGTFDAWVRTSVDEDIVIPQASVVDTTASFTYVDSSGSTQTFTFTFSLIGSLQNASASETLDHIRSTAPAVYYTQDRMVNAEDYNVFMLQDPSILKLRAINRTFAGDSKYIPWHDPSESYENVKLFGDDGMLYFQEKPTDVITPVITLDALIATYIEPLLQSTDIYTQLTAAAVPPSEIRTFFDTDEKTLITAALTPPPSPVIAEMYYNTDLFRWYTIKASDDPAVVLVPANFPELTAPFPINFITTPLITVTQTSVLSDSYTVRRLGLRLVFQSQHTQFWNTNNGNEVIDVDTLTSQGDTVTILKANVRYDRDGILSQNWIYDVLGLEVIDSGAELGLSDIHRLSVLPADINEDGIPDNMNPDDTTDFESVADIINYKVDIDLTGAVFPYTVTLPVFYIVSGGIVTTSDVSVSNAQIAIVTANSTTDVFTVSGNHTAFFGIGAGFSVSGSAGNDGAYTVVAPGATFGLGVTTIPVAVVPATTGASGQILATPLWFESDGAPVPAPAAANTISSYVTFTAGTGVVTLFVNDYVYFTRTSLIDPWNPVPTSYESIDSFIDSEVDGTDLWSRYNGRDELNFAWFHYTSRYYLVDPAPSNIIDSFIITKGYYIALKTWLVDPLATQPDLPTPLDLRTAYNYLLENKMISDTVVLHPGQIKLLFGPKAPVELQATFKVIRSPNGIMTDNQVKSTIVSSIRNFFDITLWEFGETFFYTELAAAIHAAIPTEISSVVLVPLFTTNQFGDMFQVLAREDEVFYPDINVGQVEIVAAYTATNLRLNG